MLLVFGALFGPSLIPGADVSMNLKLRNAAPFGLENGFAYILGADSLGRPILPRILYGARTTLAISLSVVFLSMVIGSSARNHRRLLRGTHR